MSLDIIKDIINIPDNNLVKLNEILKSISFRTNQKQCGILYIDDKTCVLISQNDQIKLHSNNIENVGNDILNELKNKKNSRNIENSMFKKSFKTVEDAIHYYQIVLSLTKTKQFQNSFILPPLVLRSHVTEKCKVKDNIHLFLFKGGPIIPVVVSPISVEVSTSIKSLYSKISDIRVDANSIKFMTGSNS